MSSIRNATTGVRRSLLALALAGILPATGGCNLNYERGPLNAAEDLPTDPAMELRDWPQQEALFANTSLVVYKNRFPYNYETTAEQRQDQGYVASPLAFVVQSVVFPFTFIKSPPGTKEVDRTMTYAPTYTAMPDRPMPIEGISRMPLGAGPTSPDLTEPAPTPPGPVPAPAQPAPDPVPAPQL